MQIKIKKIEEIRKIEKFIILPKQDDIDINQFNSPLDYESFYDSYFKSRKERIKCN